MLFNLKDSNGKKLILRAEAYLLDDNLDKEKFFVAFKFSESSNHIWFKTRIHMNLSLIQQSQPSELKEWVVMQKALESAVPAITLETADPKLLSKFIVNEPVINQNINSNNSLLSPGRFGDSLELKQKIQLNLVRYFLAKICLVDKVFGHSFGMLTTERKNLLQLGLFFKEKYGRKLKILREQITKPKPLPWSVLQLLNKNWWQKSEQVPIQGVFSSVEGIYSSQFYSSPPVYEEVSSSSEEMELPKVKDGNPTLSSTTKAVLKFKKLVDTGGKGWKPEKYVIDHEIVARVVTKLFTVVLYHNGAYWINTLEIQPVQNRDALSSQTRTIVEDYQIRIHQVKFPSGNQRPVTLDVVLSQASALFGIPKKELLKILGTFICMRRLNQSTHMMFSKAVATFLKSRLFTLQALRNTLNLGRSSKNKVRDELASNLQQKSLRAARNSLLVPSSQMQLSEWGESQLRRAGSNAIRVLLRQSNQEQPTMMAFDPSDYGEEWYIAKTINYRVKLFTQGQAAYSVDRRMQNSIRIKYDFHLGNADEEDYVVVRIYDFLGQKGLTLKVSDRAKFEQILPIIFHPNENFRYIMTNFMFAMKKRELMFSGYKSFRREDVYLGAHYSADLKDVKRSLLFDTYNGYLKTLNKMETVFVSVVEQLGTCIVRAETFYNWHSGDTSKRNKVFVKFVAVPHKARLAAYKLVLRDSDFVTLIGIEPYKFLGNEKVLISIFSRIFKLLRLESRGLYKTLVFPGQWVSPQAPFSRIISRKNQNSSLYFKQTDDFVEDMMFSRALICKVTTKINGKYAILIVRKSVVDGLTTIEVYLPQLRRFLYTNLHTNSSNTLNMHSPNLEKLLLDNLRSAQSGFHIQPAGSASFSKHPEVKSYQQYQSLLVPAFDNHSQTFNVSMMRPTDMSMTMGGDVTLGGFGGGTQSDVNATVLSASVADKFQTQLYWELLLSYIEVEERPRSKLVMRIGNRTVNLIKEVVFYKEVIIAERLVYFQVMAEGRDPRTAVEPFEVLQYQNLQGLQYFVKIGLVRGIKSSTKSKTHFETTEKSDKISFHKAIELLRMNIGREEPITIWKIRQVAFLLCKNLYDIILVNSKTVMHMKDLILKHRLSALLAPVDSVSTPLHSRICGETGASETESFEKLHKATLLLDIPLQVEVHLSHIRQELMFLLFNSRQRSVWAWRASVERVCESVPYFWELHSLKQFKMLGQRLISSFKNNILVDYLMRGEN